MPDLVFQPFAELAPLIRRKKLSPVELTRACLDRIQAMEPKVNAFLTVTTDLALEQARQAEREIRAGRYRGPLHGIPYGLKDLIATKGIRTTNGSKVTQDWIPDFDATVVERLRRAGAILVGKVNMLEFAMGSGQRGLKGPARNPWDLAYSPSGSSSGSGAAIAAGMVPLTIGSDSGGSIRGPAKSCGVVGLKPTRGRISLHGVTTLSWTLDHLGPMARAVADTALAMQAIDTSATVPDYSKSLVRNLKGVRIGVPRGHFFENVRPETGAALRTAMDVLKSLGAVLSDIEIRQAPLFSAVSRVILGSESAAFHEQRLRASAELLDPLVRERLEAGMFQYAVDYLRAQRLRAGLIEEMQRVFTLCDVILMPAGNAAPKLEEETVGTDLPTDPPAAPRPDSFNLANVAGIPAIVLPCGFTPGPPALPLGIQFCAADNGEPLLFRVGHAYQSATDWHRRHP